MYALRGGRVFANIALSETEHTEAVLARLLPDGIDEPAAGRPPGDFENPDLQALYERLVAAGSAGLVVALSVGALVEEAEILDIREALVDTDQSDVLQVCQNLLCGFCNHLLAFERQLVTRGIDYVAQVISQAQWDAIVSGSAVCADPL